MVDIDSRQLDVALAVLGEQLAAADETAHLVVIGGSGSLAIDAVVRSTRDVDVLALERHGELVSANPLPSAITSAAALVARDLGLEPNWLNPGPTSLLELGLPAGFADRLIVRDFDDALARALGDLGVEDDGRDA